LQLAIGQILDHLPQALITHTTEVVRRNWTLATGQISRLSALPLHKQIPPKRGLYIYCKSDYAASPFLRGAAMTTV
jgi:hypothetical protein